jgi:Flp pilus assembly protein TadD
LAVFCAAFAFCAACSGTRSVPPPTFTSDIAPILAAHCVVCHRPGHAAPFSLMSYADVQARVPAIRAAVESRRMPPWLPEHGNPSFAGERRLTDEQVETVRSWADAGAPEGDASALRLPAPSTEWELGRPDLVVSPPRPYVLEPVGHDIYRNVILSPAIAQRRFVRAVEFNPGDAPIHHAVIRVDRLHLSRARDGADGQPGFEGMAAYEVEDPDGHFLGWAPGRGPIVAPRGLPWVLDPGSDLVVELHLMPGASAASVKPTVALYFTDTVPAQSPVMIVMGSKAIDIPAGAAEYAVDDEYRLPVDAEVLSVYPHAHYLGREMEVRAIAPDGAVRQLLHIKRWSFNWQQDYRLVSPMSLPRGSTIRMRYTYDNSAANRANPHQPPRRVTWGPQSHDEMGNLGIQLLTRTADDAVLLTRSFAEHAALIDLRGAETLVKADPGNASHAALLGTSQIRLGRFADAVAPLEQALRLDPTSAANENHLAGALLALGRPADALVHFRKAVALSPRDPHLRYNLGKTLADTGRGADAFQEFSRAIAIDPGMAEAHQQLGVLLFAAGQGAAAIEHLERASVLAPMSASIHADLGGALAQEGRLQEAHAHLKRALDLNPADATARENLMRLERLVKR